MAGERLPRRSATGGPSSGASGASLSGPNTWTGTQDFTGATVTGIAGGSGGNALTRTAVKTANYTAAAWQLVPCDTTSGSFTVTLPTAPPDKTQVAVKQIIQGSTNTVTIAVGGSDVFNKASGSTSLTLSLLNQGVLLQYDSGTAIWTVVADDLPLSAFTPATATDVPFTATGTIAATNVQTAIAEAASEAAQKASNLSDLASAPTARTNLGLGGAATLSVGTTTGTVAAGDDSRITGAAQKASNLSDLASAATARTNLGAGAANGLATLDSGGQVPLAQLGNAPTGGGTATAIYNPTPQMHNLLGWTVDPVVANTLISLSAGVIGLIKMPWPTTQTVTNILVGIGTAGAGLVSCYAGLYDSSGNRLGVTADQSTPWQSTGVKTMALAGGATSITGSATTFIYAALLCGSGSTTVANMFYKCGAAIAAGVNLGLTASTARAATSGTAQTALPATITMSGITLGNNVIPVGVS